MTDYLLQQIQAKLGRGKKASGNVIPFSGSASA
jgi:hypothetical protein